MAHHFGEKCTMWFVYILRCADGSLYTGSTNDLQKRLERHNDGIAAKYTRSRRPVLVVYQEKLSSRSAALIREASIKRLSRLEKLDLIKKFGK